MFLIGLMMSDQKTEKQKTRYSGKPMSEEEYKDWQKAFTDIEECISALYKTKKKAYNKKK